MLRKLRLRQNNCFLIKKRLRDISCNIWKVFARTLDGRVGFYYEKTIFNLQPSAFQHSARHITTCESQIKVNNKNI